jgi:bis(5'-nucleosidyl)-tetraphosphatase
MASTTAATADTLVRAAGLLIYRRKASVDEFLLLQASYEPFHWTPPKGKFSEVLTLFLSDQGHVDPGENEWTAAIREVREEAGIDAMDKLEIHTEFKHEMFYTVKSKPKKVGIFKI